MELDVTDRDAVFETVRRAHERFGRLDIVVNNAGYGQFALPSSSASVNSRRR